MVTRITELSTDRPVVDGGGSLTSQSRTYFRTLTDFALIVGIGNPEGSIEAPQGAEFMDEQGNLGAILYKKRDNSVLGDKTKGWFLIG